MKKLIFSLLTSLLIVTFAILSIAETVNTTSTFDSSAVVCNAIKIDKPLADEEIQKIQKAYENLTDMKGSFIQKSYIKDLKRTDIYNGQFFIKMPFKLRWIYKGKFDQEVFIDNDDILIYQKKEKQAFRGKFDRTTYGQAPIALLSGFGKIQEEFIVSTKNSNLFLKPKNPLGGVLSIEIKTSVSGFPISYFILTDKHSNRIEILLKNVEINTGLKETLFKPSLPEDVKIHEYNSGD